MRRFLLVWIPLLVTGACEDETGLDPNNRYEVTHFVLFERVDVPAVGVTCPGEVIIETQSGSLITGSFVLRAAICSGNVTSTDDLVGQLEGSISADGQVSILVHYDQAQANLLVGGCFAVPPLEFTGSIDSGSLEIEHVGNASCPPKGDYTGGANLTWSIQSP